MKQRGYKVIVIIAAILILGLTYLVLLNTTSFSIHCIIYEMTGLECPTCGLTRLCLALSRLDLQGAFFAHPIIFCYIIPLLYVIIKWIRSYIIKGSYSLGVPEKIILVTFIIAMIIFAIVRNLV